MFSQAKEQCSAIAADTSNVGKRQAMATMMMISRIKRKAPLAIASTLRWRSIYNGRELPMRLQQPLALARIDS